MKINSKSIKKLYADKMANGYNKKVILFEYDQWKEHAINSSHLKPKDRVLVFCCGTGFDFRYILNKIGQSGYILGVDFSPQMLEKARKAIAKNGWNNVEVREADVTEFDNKNEDYFDAGVCTLGMSIIPDFKKAYSNLLSYIKPGGQLIISDMQLASGWRSILNPLTVTLGRQCGGSYSGYKNTKQLFELMNKDLSNIQYHSFFQDTYRICIGLKP